MHEDNPQGLARRSGPIGARRRPAASFWHLVAPHGRFFAGESRLAESGRVRRVGGNDRAARRAIRSRRAPRVAAGYRSIGPARASDRAGVRRVGGRQEVPVGSAVGAGSSRRPVRPGRTGPDRAGGRNPLRQPICRPARGRRSGPTDRSRRAGAVQAGTAPGTGLGRPGRGRTPAARRPPACTADRPGAPTASRGEEGGPGCAVEAEEAVITGSVLGWAPEGFRTPPGPDPAMAAARSPRPDGPGPRRSRPICRARTCESRRPTAGLRPIRTVPGLEPRSSPSRDHRRSANHDCIRKTDVPSSARPGSHSSLTAAGRDVENGPRSECRTRFCCARHTPPSPTPSPPDAVTAGAPSPCDRRSMARSRVFAGYIPFTRRDFFA